MIALGTAIGDVFDILNFVTIRLLLRLTRTSGAHIKNTVADSISDISDL